MNAFLSASDDDDELEICKPRVLDIEDVIKVRKGHGDGDGDGIVLMIELLYSFASHRI